MPEQNKKSFLEVKNVTKLFPKVETDEVTHALQDINITMESGEFISLVGTSGCGKSTLLRHIAGLVFPTQGELLVNGEPITGPSPERGVVFQNPTLFPWLTVEKNISFSLDVQGVTEGKEERVRHMLEIIGLTAFKDDYPGQLSGGMAQRVALARTLINEPEIMLLDEPLGALDEFTRMNMQDEVLNIWSQRKNLAVMVTHSIDEAVYMSTRVLVMESKPGRIIDDIRIDEEYPRDRSSAKFIEYRNEILNRLHYGGKRLAEE